jgi:hypothetical protein
MGRSGECPPPEIEKRSIEWRRDGVAVPVVECNSADSSKIRWLRLSVIDGQARRDAFEKGGQAE